MAYLELPNGKYLKIPEGMSPDQAYASALEKFPNLLEEPEQRKGFGAAVGKGTESVLSSLQTGLESLVAPERAAKKGLARQQELGEKYAEQIGTEKLREAYEKSGLIGAGGELLRQVPLAIGEQLPNLATMFAGAKLGARAPIPGVYGKLIGAGLGALAPSALQQFGSNIERQAAEQVEAGQPIDISRGKAAAAAAPQAALDVAASFIPLGGKVAGKVFGPEVEKLLMRGGTEAAEKLAKESFAKTLGKGLAVGAAAEIPTEITQQMLERAQAGLSLTSPDALKEYGETAYQVGLLAPIGGAGRFIDKSSARAGIAERQKAEETRIAEEQAKVAEEERLNKEAMDEMAKIAAENKPTFALSEQQLEEMRADIGTQRFKFNKELDDLRAQAQKETDIDKLVDISSRAEKIQSAIEEMSPGFIKRKIQDTAQQIKAANKELKAAEKDKDEAKVADLKTQIATLNDSIEDMKAKLPAYEEAPAVVPPKQISERIAAKMKQVNKAKDLGDLAELAKLTREVKELQRQYTGMQMPAGPATQGDLFETVKGGFAYPEAERREAAAAEELAATRPDLLLGMPKPREEKLPSGIVSIRDTELQTIKTPKEQRLEETMEETMDLLRESLPEQEKKQIQEIKMLPLGELRARLATLEKQKREVLKENPELLKVVNEDDMLAALEKGKKAKPAFTQAANKLAGIEDSIIATQQRIDEEEFGKRLPPELPLATYDLPRGFPKAKYQRFADQTKRNAEDSLDELVQSLFNMTYESRLSSARQALAAAERKQDVKKIDALQKQIASLETKYAPEDIANTPELLTKKIEGLRAIVVRSLLRQATARRYAEGAPELSTDAALKLASRVDANLRELIDRIPALPKSQVIDRLGMAVEPRLEIRGMPSQIKFKKMQTELAEIRGELAKLAGVKEKNEFQKNKQEKLEKRQEFLEKELGGVLTGKGLKPTIVEKLGEITIDPRDLSERPFANLKRALQLIKEDINDAVDEATQTTGRVQKVTPLEEGKLTQERDPIAGLNKLLPKTNKVEKLKTQLYQAQNAAKPDAELIKDLKNQLIDEASDKRSAALFLDEIEKTKAVETKEAIAKEKAEAPPPKEGGISRIQGELFPETLATLRATPQNFMRFLNSAELFRMREKLDIKLKKVVDGMRVDIEDVSGRMPKAPTLVELQKQREIVNDLNKLDEVIANYRFNAAQLWQGRRKIADALEQSLKDLATGTTPRIEELKKNLKKYAFKQYSPEYKKIAEQIKQLQNRLYEENFSKMGNYAAALVEFDATVEERNATIDAMQERIQDLMVRNVKEERKILARMERKFANKVAPGALERKKYADKARTIIAEAEADIEKARDKRIATKRIEEQNRAESLAQFPVIRRVTRQTRSFTKGEETKALRAQIRELEEQQAKYNPGTPQHAKLSVKIGSLKADVDRAVQPLLRTVVQAEITPESPVKRVSKKEGVRFPRGATKGYDYLVRDTKAIDELLEEAQKVARAEAVAKGKAVTFLPPTEVKEEKAQKVKLSEVKQKEAEARDELEATKKKLVEHNRSVAATEKALKNAKTPKKIAELKKKLAGLRQSSTKQELGEKVNELTKKYRELRAIGSGVERTMTLMEDESLKRVQLKPLKTGVKAEQIAKEKGAKTRRELYEEEAMEAGVRSADYLDILDGLERGFSPREEKVAEGKGIDRAEVEKLLGKIKMPKGLKVQVIDTIPEGMADIIRGKGYNPANIKGWVGENGTVTIVAGAHKNAKDAEETIAHELIGHVGVEGILGKDGMKALARKVIAQEGGVMALAEKLGVRDDAMGAYMASIKSGETKEEAQIQALREIIAHTAEATPTKSFLQKANDFIKAMVGAVRAFLRKMGVDLDISTSDVYKLIRDARKNFDSITPGAYVEDGKINFRSGAAVANPGFENALKYTKGIVAEQKGFLDRIKGEATGMIFETKYVDRFAPLAAVAERMKDSLQATQMMYYLRMHDQRMAFTSEIASSGPLDLVKAKDGKGVLIESVKGASLADMAKALGKARVGNEQATIRVFTLWMAAQRAKDPRIGLNKLNFSGKITQQMLDEVERNVAVDRQTAAAFKEASDIYAKYNEGLINFAVKTGAIAKKDADIMLKNKNFIPFYRERPNTKEVFLEIGGAPAIKIGNLTQQPYLHELIGGDQPIFDIFTSSLQNTAMLTDMALRNLSTKNVANSLASVGMLKVAENSKDNGIHKGDGPTGPNIIRFKSDGENYWAEVDTKTTDIPSELLVKGMEGVNTALPEVVQMMNAPANLLRKWVTRNPAYTLRQLIRDPLNAVMVAGLDTVPVASSVKEIAKMWRGTNEGEFLLQRRGILGGQVLTGTTEDQKKILNDILSGKKGWDYRMAQLDKIAIQGDASTRIVLYNNYIKQGLSEMEATLATLESMNFSKRGISPSLFALSTMVPFMNAQIQGLNVMYKAFTGKMPFSEKLKIKQKLMQRATMMAAFSFIYASMMQDDEAYQNANDDEKYSNWFVPNPFGEGHIKIPIPFEMGLVFKAFPEALYNTVIGDEKLRDTGAAIGKLAWNAIPISMPQGVKPAIEVFVNYSFYTGRDIESPRLQQLEASERYTERTSEIAKMVGGVLGNLPFGIGEYLSPVKIEYLVRGYTGSVPLAVASLANPILRSGEAGEKPDTRGLIGAETPLIGSFFQPKDATGLINKAYKDMDDIIKAKETYKKMVEDGREDDAEKYLDANADVIGMASLAGKFRQQMGELTKQERMVRSDNSLTGKEKREQLDEIRQAKIELSKMLSGRE